MTDNEIRSERHRFCPTCGAEAVTGGSFCSECGRTLIKPPADSVDVRTDVIAEADGAAQSSNPTWDSIAWDKRIVSELTVALADSGIPHSWDGSVLSTTPEYEAKVDAILDDLSPTWDLTGWDDAIAGELTEALVELEIPHHWDGSVLMTDPDDEAEVDALLDELSGVSKVPQAEASSDVTTANHRQASSEVARKRRKWLWPVGVAFSLLVAAGVIFGVPQIRHDVLGGGSATHSGNTGQTPEQQFANDAMGIQTVLSAVNNGTLTRAQIGSYGDSICNLMPQRLNQYGPGPSAFNSIANEFYEGLTHFRISGTDDGKWVALAITDICPTYVTDIPAGVTP